jgi:hypothetical protein
MNPYPVAVSTLPLQHQGLYPCILRLSRLDRLPRHVRQAIAPTFFEGHDVIDYRADPATGITHLPHKLFAGLVTAGDVHLRIAWASRRRPLTVHLTLAA